MNWTKLRHQFIGNDIIERINNNKVMLVFQAMDACNPKNIKP